MTQNLPAHLQGLQAPDIGGSLSATLGSAMPPHVSISDNRFTLVDAANNEIPVPTFDPKLGPYLDAAIVDVNNVMSRIYFDGPYDKGAEGKRPDCFSDNGVGPSISAGSPQAPTCAACPRSEWTKVNANGNKVPWCTQKQKIALLIPGFQTLFLLAVPPNSHGPMREYVNHCKGNGVNIADLVTRISFVSQGTLQFAPVTYIDAPTAQLRQAAYAEKKTDALVGRTDVARPAGAITQQPAQQIARTNPNAAGTNPQDQSSATFGQHQQVQQPGPFANPPAGSLQFAPNTQPAAAQPTAATTSPFDPAPTTRRRRRTAAEMAQAASQAPNGAAAPPQAPFPHPGGTHTQQGTPAPFPPSTQPQGTQAFIANAPSQQAPQGSFGVAEGQPAANNPELAGMLDNFFKS